VRTHRSHRNRAFSLSVVTSLLMAAIAWFPTTARVANAAAGGVAQAECGPAPAGYARCLSVQVMNSQAARALDGSLPAGYSPTDLHSAYNFPSAVAGSGLTVGIIDAYDDPTAESDLGVYRAEFGIPPCTTANGCFRKVNQTGGSTYPAPDVSWSGEISLDLDMVSAICPFCHIVLVEVDNNSMTYLGMGDNEAAALGAYAISNSWGGVDWVGENQYDQYFNHPGIAITAASGDWGYGASYPAVVPSVIAVGGTRLMRTGNGRGWSETVWNNNSGASGAGCSAYEPQPAWQTANSNITGTGCTGRASSDVSVVADPYTGVAVYDSTDREAGWGIFGGTSTGSPIIASAFALADNPSVTTPPYLYSHAATLNDVTSGNNIESWAQPPYDSCGGTAICTAGIGWDGPTGLGTPTGITTVGGGPAVISSLTPAEGPVTGGQVVTVAGTGFELGMTATLGATAITPSAVSANSFTFIAPAEAAGVDQLEVTTSEGVSTPIPAAEYTYGDLPAISSIAPPEGPVGGGQTVTVTGTAFEAGMTATVGGTAVTPSAVSATSFTFTTPPEPVGLAQVQVTTWAGASAFTAADDYTYGDLPVISSVTPTVGLVSGGQTVAVTGAGFEAGMTATIGGTVIAPSLISASSFTFTTPEEPAGLVQLQVTTLDGASVLTSAADYTYGNAPTIGLVTPDAGLVSGGQTVAVTGSGFVAGMMVTIGGTAVTPAGVTPTSFTFATPAEGAGLVDIQVTTSFGASALTAADEYLYGSLPVISAVTPAGGPVSGGQPVTVTGSGFTAGMTATIGGTGVTLSGISATSFSFTTPAELAGLVQIQVTTPIGANGLTPADDYTYGSLPLLTSLSRPAGLVAGGQSVTVTGSGFEAGMTVSIGGVAVTPMSVTPTSFTFITPAENAGMVDIQVTTVIGTSLLTAADEYTYGSLPVISAVTPAGGLVSGGQTVTVAGSGFTAGMTGTIGGTAVTPSGVSATSFTFTAPVEAAGVMEIQVTTVIGASALSPADAYTYTTLPVISAVTPSAGPVTGGQLVTVTGSGFVAGMTATIGGTTVTPSGISANSFTFTTPAETAGYDQIQVTDLAGTSALTPAAGYIYSGLGSYVPLTPFRIMDTRSGHCGVHTCGALGAGQTLPLQITGYSVPANATAVVLNVLAVNGSAASLLTVSPSGTGRPLASNLNFNAHVNIANLVTVALGQNSASDTQREVNIFNAVGTVNVVVDIEGYFVPQASSNPAGEFHAIAPLRVCDTRAKQPANGCNQGHSTDNQIGPGQVLKVKVSGIPSGVGGSAASIPTDGTAGAAVLNLTAVAGTQATWLSVFPTQPNGTCLTSVPASSTINVSAGGAEANRVMARLGPSHSGGLNTDVCVYNAAGTINVVLDASGWFGSATGSPPTGAQYQAIGPTRICDTRSGTGTLCSGHQLTSGGTQLVRVAGVGGIPGSGAVAIIANLTAVGGSQSTYLTVYPADVSPKPNASDVNLNPGIALPNLVVVGLATGAHPGDVNLFNAMGSINAVLDVDGWFQ
jgi:hypothetical protein